MTAWALQVWRASELLAAPQFWGEEGSHFFRDAYLLGLGSLGERVGGYWHLVPRLCALAAKALPLEWVPAFFVGASLASQLLVYACIWSPRVPLHSGARLLFTLAPALVPHGGEVLLNLTNAQWYLALAIPLVLSSAPPKSTRELAADVVLLTLLGLTGPYLLLFLPVCALLQSPWMHLRPSAKSRWAGQTKTASLPAIAAHSGANELVGSAGHSAGSREQAFAFMRRLSASAHAHGARWRLAAAIGLALWHGLHLELQMRASHQASHASSDPDAWLASWQHLVLPFFLGNHAGICLGFWQPLLAVLLGSGVLALAWPRRCASRALALRSLACGALCYGAGLWERRDLPDLLHPYRHGQRMFFLLYVATAWCLSLVVTHTAASVRRRRLAGAALAACFAAGVYDGRVVLRRIDYDWPGQVAAFERDPNHEFIIPPNWRFRLHEPNQARAAETAPSGGRVSH